MNTERMKLPLGISDFIALRETGANYLYVDKTAQLAGLLGAGKYLFLARPRRFGKSLLCSTTRCLYEGRRELFAGLAIETKRYYEPWLADGRPIVLLGAGGFMEKDVKCIWKEV